MKTLSYNVRSLALPIVIFGEIFLANCSTLSLTYRYADWLMHWKIDHYIDITSEQRSYLNKRVEIFKKWHKGKEIPRYISFLQYIKIQWQDGLTRQELDSIFLMYQALWKDLSLRLATESSPLLETLSTDQIQSLQRAIWEDNQDLLDQRTLNPRNRMDMKVEKALDRLEDWVGPLTVDQNLLIDQKIRNLPDTFQAWFDNRVRRQYSFIALLNQKSEHQELQQEVGELLGSPEQGATQSYISAMQQQKTAVFSIILSIDELIDSHQREHATNQIEKLILELKLIMHE